MFDFDVNLVLAVYGRGFEVYSAGRVQFCPELARVGRLRTRSRIANGQFKRLAKYELRLRMTASLENVTRVETYLVPKRRITTKVMNATWNRLVSCH